MTYLDEIEEAVARVEARNAESKAAISEQLVLDTEGIRALLNIARAADKAALEYGRTTGRVLPTMEELRNALDSLSREEEPLNDLDRDVETVHKALLLSRASGGNPVARQAAQPGLDALDRLTVRIKELEQERDEANRWLRLIAKTQHRLLAEVHLNLSDEEWDAFEEALDRRRVTPPQHKEVEDHDV